MAPPSKSPFTQSEVEPGEMPEGELCPHLGFVAIPVPQKGVLHGGQPAIQISAVMQPCQRERCKMWNAEAEDCTFNIQTSLMQELVDRLKKLAGG